MTDAYIIAPVRTPGGKAPRGVFRDTRPEYLGKLVMEETIKRAGIAASQIDDVIWGCATPEQCTGMNTGRITAMYAGIPATVPAVTVNRFCSSGLQAIAFAAEAVLARRCDMVLAGGVEHMSMIAMGGVIRPNPDILGDPAINGVYASMGQTAENVALRYGINRGRQDEFAVASHQKAAAATLAGRFNEEIVPVPVRALSLGPESRPLEKTFVVNADEGIRPESNLEAMAGLPPAFTPKGSVTAGNSSQTTDGAAACLIASGHKVKELGLKPLGRFIAFAVAGCAPDEMGVGPVYAVPKVLEKSGLKLEDIGLFELNEAFASQSLYCIEKLGIDPALVNVNGGAIALGHPMGATGAKLTATLLYEMKRRQVRYGMVTMCVGGGQGAAGIFELAK